MARGNIVLGMARGKVGDIVLSRSNGEQITRVRNRHPYNPKTNAQLAQRAIMATVMRAYSVGKVIFDHSFEGKKVPSGNQRYFVSKNAKLLRTAIAAGFAGSDVRALVVGPGTNTPVANAYLISEGSLNQSFFTLTTPTQSAATSHLQCPAAASETETIAEYMARLGLQPGDIYTIVAFAMGGDEMEQFVVEGTDDVNAIQQFGEFGFARLVVKSPANPEALASATSGSEIFQLDESSTIQDVDLLSSDVAGYDTSINTVLSWYGDAIPVSVGIIRSRENDGKRSTETMKWVQYNDVYGLNYEYMLPAWTQGAATVGDSDLILEGGNF